VQRENLTGTVAVEEPPEQQQQVEPQQQQEEEEEENQTSSIVAHSTHVGTNETVSSNGTAAPELSDIVRHKASILMQIMEAGPAVEQVIEKHSDEIDHIMLELLEKRIQAARKLEQDDEVIQGMVVLYSHLKAEYDRNTASPALRLLDTLLQIMATNPSDDEYASYHKEMNRKVMARMQMAFDASMPLETDVLSVAQQIAEGKRRFIDEIVNESVKPSEFIHEVDALLTQARDQQAMLKQHIENQGSVSADVQKVLENRQNAIDNVEEILSMATELSNRLRIQ
jgi:hypothetical protein